MVKYVYYLYHRHKICFDSKWGWIYDTKEIGYFTSIKKMDKVLKSYKKIIGFRDYPNDFVVEKISIFSCSKNTSFLYDLTHFYEDIDGDDIVTYLGCYSSLKEARNRREMLKYTSRFLSHPEAFLIRHIKLNQCSWCEGFVPNDE